MSQPAMSQTVEQFESQTSGALANDAVHGDFAADYFHELFTNRQAQTGSAKIPRGRSVRLDEFLKQLGLDIFRYPNTRIRDFKTQLHAHVVTILHFNRNSDRTVICEFERVPRQVEQNLP